MKKILILISLASVLILASCTNNTVTPVAENNLDTNQENMVKNTGPVKAGDDIAVHYKGTLEDGTKFDSSYDRGETLPFKVWAGQMIKGFDAGVVGMMVWDKKTITMEPKDAYGEYDETKVQVIPKTDLASFTAAGFELKVGEKLPTQMWELAIIKVTEEEVTLDMNHALAGKKLTFEVELVEIK